MEIALFFSLFLAILSLLITCLEFFVGKARDKSLHYILKILIYVLALVAITILVERDIIDELSTLFSLIAIAVSVPVSIYAIDYSIYKGYSPRLHVLIDLFALTIIYTFASPNLLMLAIAWTSAELIGFTLINLGEQHFREKGSSSYVSRRFLSVSTATFELTLFTMIYVSIFSLAASASLEQGIKILFMKFDQLKDYSSYVPLYVVPLLAVGFIAKSAQIPLHFWLPDAHTIAPSPASALLSGVMTGMGVYGFLRIYQITKMDPFVLNVFTLVILFLSITSIIYGGLQSYVQKDVKRVLAYSTIAGNGFTLSLFALYIVNQDAITYTALLASFVSHAIYKSSLFLDAGSIEVVVNERSIENIRGLSMFVPVLSTSSIIALFSLIGMPPTIGFVSKLLAILACISGGLVLHSLLVIIAIVFSIIMSVLMGFKYVMMYYGEPSNHVINALRNKDLSIFRNLFYVELALSSLNILALLILAFTPIEKDLINAILLASLIPVIVLIYIAVMIAMRGGVRYLRQ